MEIKVLFHIDENAKWGLLLANCRNLLKAAGENRPEIEVVANSEAVKGFAGGCSGADADLMRWLSEAGAGFVACNNALNGLGIRKEQLPPFVRIVPAGVLELVLRQAEGFAYIKP